MHGLVEKAALYYHRELLQGQNGAGRARAYLGERRVFAPTAELFKLGYAPERGSGALSWLQAKIGATDTELLDAGLLVRSESGVLVDPMAGRVVFPQASPSAKYVGFVGRLLGQDGRKDKYLSTPRSDIFRRAEVLYRIDIAKQSIITEGWALVVEGMLDAVLLWQVGQRNVIASGTTALTDAQAQIVSRFAQKIEVMFDSGPVEYEAYERIRKQRGSYFPKGVEWKAVPGGASDPAEWAQRQIDNAIISQQPVIPA